MIDHLILKNFKAWQDTGQIVLKPVTMFLGTNSSGKSSLLQSLLLLKQTALSPDRSIHLNLGGDDINDIFNFGTFEDILHQGAKVPRRFEIIFGDLTNNLNDGLALITCFAQNSAGGVILHDWQVTSGARLFRATRTEKGAYSIYVDHELQARGTSRTYAPERSISLPPEALTLLGQNKTNLEDLSLRLHRQLDNISYLGPLRRKPERDYVWNKSKPGSMSSDGHRAIDILLSSALMKGDEQNNILNGVAKWLKKMKVADKLKIKQVGRSSRYEVIITRSGVESNLRDVGIGVSQVLPVLTLAYFAPAGSTIILEEPEIHLHPLAQSVLAELFVEVSAERKVQFLVETHSEHLFRRMQTLIASENTNDKQTAMYFVEKNGKSAKLVKLNVDTYGRLQNWPDNFFGDALGETRQQAQFMINRMKAKSNRN